MIQPFSLPNPFTDPIRHRLVAAASPWIEKTLALETLNRIYAGLPGAADGRHFTEKALEALGVALDIDPEELAAIPRVGPLVVVANHPFGGLDGLAMAALLRRVRPDVKLLGNHLLRSIPDLRDTLIPVDPFGGAGAAARNAASLRAALRWVRGGGALGIFPAGEVSHVTLRGFGVADPAWSVAAGRFIRATGATVVCLHFEGRNSALFQAAGLLHPLLRTALLPRELLKHRGRALRVRAGTPIPADRIAACGSPEETIGYLRVRAGVLGGARRRPAKRAAPGPAPEPIATAENSARIAADIAALPPSQRLIESGPFEIWHARAGQIPAALREIGRLREIAFRQVGEGTGRALDLDRFDDDYLHLFVWNRETSEIVGAYRMGPTDEILPRRGVAGLYTSTLFRFSAPLIDQIGPALEMGRSFVRPEYQKNHSPLALLWKGIGRFVVAHPRYRRLFGPVSISNEYQSMSRSLLFAFLRMNRYVEGLGRLIRPRNRARVAPPRDWDPALAGAVVKDLDEVDTLIREIETDRKSMPILLRQYLRLNGVLLGFNIDPAFGDVLDGLILVDLASVDRALLGRYMGREGMEAFLCRHEAGGRRRDQSAGAGAVRAR